MNDPDDFYGELMMSHDDIIARQAEEGIRIQRNYYLARLEKEKQKLEKEKQERQKLEKLEKLEKEHLAMLTALQTLRNSHDDIKNTSKYYKIPKSLVDDILYMIA